MCRIPNLLGDESRSGWPIKKAGIAEVVTDSPLVAEASTTTASGTPLPARLKLESSLSPASWLVPDYLNPRPVDGIQHTRQAGVKCGDGRPMHHENWFFGRILHEMITAQES
jgi:hypothetical protein